LLQHVFVIRKTTEITSQLNMIALMKKWISSYIDRLDAITRAAMSDAVLLGFKRKLGDAGLMNITSAPIAFPTCVIGYKIMGT